MGQKTQHEGIVSFSFVCLRAVSFVPFVRVETRANGTKDTARRQTKENETI
jgi:hypothetical protein